MPTDSVLCAGADIRSLCTEAAMTPLREIARNSQLLSNIREEDVPSVSYSHFLQAIEVVQPSVSSNDLKRYIAWNSEFGTYRKIE
jgi:SpoVK/Ycf46/Vps4 family AAA+-type ATPase